VSLEEICAGDPALMARLAEQIRSSQAVGDSPPLGQTVDFDHAGYRQQTPRDQSVIKTPMPQTRDIDTDLGRQERPAQPLPETLSQGRYAILGELGKGGMGVVYRAKDQRTGREVALKTMQRQDGLALDFFKKEFRYLQGVSHPHLVQLYDLESDGQDWLLTMDVVEGVDFLTYVRPEGHLDVERLREAVGQLAEGVAALHAYRRVHRDLKPQNVRVTPEGKVVVLDFGLAADVGPSGEHRQTDRLMPGTVPYMAPEQCRRPPVSSSASDWYSVGVMLYQALTGRLPFTGNVANCCSINRTSTRPLRSRSGQMYLPI
jgi:serine/threonine protein kinase